MRLITAFICTAGAASCFLSSLSAQDAGEGRIIALDTGAASLLRACCPKTEFECLIKSTQPSYQTLNSRALSMRNASCVIYRGDRLSFTSQLFLSRMQAHGVHAIDLAAYAAQRHSSPKWAEVANKTHEFFKKDSFAMTLAIEQFRKTGNGL